MNQFIKLKLLAIAVILSQLTFAQTNGVKSFTLNEAVSFAKSNNYSIKNSALDVESSQKKVNEVLASGLPQINASGNFTNNTTIATNVINFGGKSTALQFGQKFSSAAGLGVNQLLFDGGFLMGVKAASEFVNLAKLNKNRTEIETEVNVTKAYYLSLLMSTNLTMLDTNIATLLKSKSDLEKVVKGGLAESTDLDRLELQASNLMLQRDKISDQQRLADMILKLQLGMSVNDSVILKDNLIDLFKTSKFPVVESKVDYSKRTEYKLLDQQMKLQSYDRKRYLLGYAPSLNAFFNMQRNSFDSTFSGLGTTWYPATSWGLNLSIPIFDGFRKHAQTQQAKISMYKIQNDKRNLENAIDQQIFQSKMAFERSNQQLIIQEKNLQLAQHIYDKVSLKFKNGLSSSLELTTAQNDVAVARQNYLQTIYDYFSAQIDLRKATGDIK